MNSIFNKSLILIKNLILECLTIYKDVNIELVRNIKKYITDKWNVLVKSHPLKCLNKQYLLNSNDNFIDVSDKTFKGIYQTIVVQM